MIVASLLLIVAAIVLLLVGLVDGTNGYLVGSITASLLASLTLIVAGRRHAARRARWGGSPVWSRVSSPVDATLSRSGLRVEEPEPQTTSVGDAARVASLASTVIVVEGYRRYHRGDCSWLRGRPQTRLRAREAVEAGYTPCGCCEPDTMLLASG